MKVMEIMSTDLQVCSPETTVADAARLMWEADCGILPVVDEGELVGVVTDRDMYIALATRQERASHLRIGAVATAPVATCGPDDDGPVGANRRRRADPAGDLSPSPASSGSGCGVIPGGILRGVTIVPVDARASSELLQRIVRVSGPRGVIVGDDVATVDVPATVFVWRLRDIGWIRDRANRVLESPIRREARNGRRPA